MVFHSSTDIFFNHRLPLKRPHNHKKEVLNNFSRKRGVIMFPNDLNFHHTKKPFYINLKVIFFFFLKKRRREESNKKYLYDKALN